MRKAIGSVAASSKLSPGGLIATSSALRHDMTAEGEAGDRQHLVADMQVVDALADRRDPAAALGTERHGAVGQAGIQSPAPSSRR